MPDFVYCMASKISTRYDTILLPRCHFELLEVRNWILEIHLIATQFKVPCVKRADGEYQIPIFTPYDITVLNLKFLEVLFTFISIILWMRMTTQKCLVFRQPYLKNETKSYTYTAYTEPEYQVVTAQVPYTGGYTDTYTQHHQRPLTPSNLRGGVRLHSH